MKGYTFLTVSLTVCAILLSHTYLFSQNTSQQDIYTYRTMDGSFNDLRNQTEGMAGNEFIRMHDKSYYFRDGQTMMDRGNARHISNQMFHQYSSRPDPNNLSSLVFTFLQFLDHDITFTKQDNSESHPITIPKGDPQFDPFSTGKQSIPFSRVAASRANSAQRQQINEISAWIDASMIYGSDDGRAAWLRSGNCGKLKVSPSQHGDLLPCNTITGNCNDRIDPNAPEMDGDHNRFGQGVKVFVAGDIRANEQPGLTALHTLFVREHNRICDELRRIYGCDDELLYQRARKMVGGLIQSVVYNELLPLLGIELTSDAYSARSNGDIHNSFATAAYRLGHTMITEQIPLVYGSCNNGVELVPLKDLFFNPDLIMDEGISPILKGLSVQTQETIDAKIVSAVRNFLFGSPGSGGLDLAAINIQRGRDHGLPDYNSLRIMLGLGTVRSFSQITNDNQVAASLEDIYRSVNNIDAWVGMLAEKHLPNKSVGPTLHALLAYQFNNLRKSDRFYYTRDPLLNASEISTITDTRLADVINRNTQLNNLREVFHNKEQCLPIAETPKSQTVECNEILITHTPDGELTIQGVHGLDYSYRVSRDPMGILLTDNCMMLCGNYFEASLSPGTYYVTVANRNVRTVCDARIEIPASFASSNKLVSSSTISNTLSNTPEFSVFPNPSSDQLNIQFNAQTKQNSQIYLINTLGQILETIPTNTSNSYQVDVSNYPSGLYELVVMDKEEITIPATRQTVIIH